MPLATRRCPARPLRLAQACILAALLALCSAACGDGPGEGELYFLTYNVAGLPQGISKSDPVRNIPIISPMLNAFDHVNVQEDFYYQDQLRADVTLPHQSEPQRQGVPSGFGDGLNRFSRFAWRDFQRIPFSGCEGADCGAKKGTSVALHTLAQGIEVDIYNLHFEAGSSKEAETIRAANTETLISTITSRSRGRAIIVAGDFNLQRADGAADIAALSRLRQEAGLIQVCDALQCGDDRVDRIFFRGSSAVRFVALQRTVDMSFVDKKGVDLSDHEAVSARLRWVRR